MDFQVQSTVSTRIHCQSNDKSQVTHPAPLQPVQLPEGPWKKLGAVERFHCALRGCIQTAIQRAQPWNRAVTVWLQDKCDLAAVRENVKKTKGKIKHYTDQKHSAPKSSPWCGRENEDKTSLCNPKRSYEILCSRKRIEESGTQNVLAQ
ncbi:Envelope glycoprotein [Labeo rohita]|uniref:Envelope glycoprotein n=1 Tax=Labeo rohita TaxID=84645 RepID=A0ABQ8LSG8_LABRO|nr:Envelope glycoprotein [Labeo rohita]